MIDWTKSMSQTFEYYKVDPISWGITEKLDTVISSSVTFDIDSESISSANITLSESVGEIYVRIYLICNQDDIDYRFCLGTYLIQTPNISFNGTINNISVDAYSPLLELKEKYTPIGYYIPKNTGILDTVGHICRDVIRPPVVIASDTEQTKMESGFVSEVNETYLAFLSSALKVADYRFDLDDEGRILFTPIDKLTYIRPVWTYNDDNSSILYPDITSEKDLYGIPNVVEVLYSSGTEKVFARAENHDPTSPTSIESRGREIVHRNTSPPFSIAPLQTVLDQYAERTLENMSMLKNTITYKHGYCSVRVGDGVRINYEKAGIKNVIAKVIKQSISCEPGCPVEETAIFMSTLYNSH